MNDFLYYYFKITIRLFYITITIFKYYNIFSIININYLTNSR